MLFKRKYGFFNSFIFSILIYLFFNSTSLKSLNMSFFYFNCVMLYFTKSLNIPISFLVTAFKANIITK